MTGKSLNIYTKGLSLMKVFGQLVLLGYDITAFTPAAYLRSSLLRPFIEI
jgi:hypothetical protein